jgi:hypothetical protein
MKKISFTVEKNADGYWAHRTEPGGVVGAYGVTLDELKADIVEAYNLFQDEVKITMDSVLLQFNVSSFFELYSGVVAAAGIGKRAGMQKSLISDYVNRKKRPSKKQIERLVATIKELGRELAEVEIV